MKTKLGAICAISLASLFASACCSEKKGAATEEDSAHFAAVKEHLDLGGPVFGYVDIDGDVEKLAETINGFLAVGRNPQVGELPPQIANLDMEQVAEELGLSGIDAIGVSSKKKNGLYRNTFYVHAEGGRAGLLKLLGDEAAEFATKKLAPADTDLLIEQDIDLKTGFSLVEMLVRRFGGADGAAEFARMANQPTPMGASMKDMFDKLDTKVMLVARVHSDKPLEIPGAPIKFPGVDALVAIDNVGDLFKRALESFKVNVPLEEQRKYFEKTEAYEQIDIPVPPDAQSYFTPVVRHDAKSGRVFLATSQSYIEECLTGNSTLWEDESFKKTIAGLPEEGNGITYVSEQLMGEYMRLYTEAMKMAESKGMPQGFAELIAKLISGAMGDGKATASVTVALPKGLLMTQNASASFKDSMGGSVAVAMLAGMGSYRAAARPVVPLLDEPASTEDAVGTPAIEAVPTPQPIEKTAEPEVPVVPELLPEVRDN